MSNDRIEKVVRIATIGIVIYLLGFGIAQAFFPIRPFWNDEWRLIYNIKFKDINGLWGRLDLLQECPRVYLSVLKWISQAFDYSYTSLRLPPLIIGLASVFFIFRLRLKLYPRNGFLSYLFILILVSSQTFTDYLVQVKQYEMDIFLCLLALWQLITLLEISEDRKVGNGKYVLLCLTFLLVTYLSYIFPITVAPIFPVMGIALFLSKKGNQGGRVWKIIAPLILVTISIAVFYYIDVSNVMADEKMYVSYQKAYYHGHKETFIEDFWNLFALVGSGFVFEIIFGVLGIVSFFYAIYKLLAKRFYGLELADYIRMYAVGLLILVLILFAMGKLTGGVARLTAYAVPSISILIISLLEDLRARTKWVKPAGAIAAILFVALFINIITSCINTFTYSEYSNRIETYRRTGDVLKLTRQSKLPIMITDGVNGDKVDSIPPAPGRVAFATIDHRQIEGADTLAPEAILKVHPEYKVWDTVTVFYIPDMHWTQEYIRQLPQQFSSAIAFDGIHYQALRK